MNFCGKTITNRSKYADPELHKCYKPLGHSGRCLEFPYLQDLKASSPRVEAKIRRDSTMTTGASWKSKDAGPNRAPRWAMLKTDAELLKLRINMSKLKPQVVAKLREKAAPYHACMEVAQKLTFLAYGMQNAPSPSPAIKTYLEALFGNVVVGSTVCLICREALDYSDFAKAQRGKAEIETSHSDPRTHTADNVGFAHRGCNIAQGNRTLDQFYDWIAAILARVRAS